MTTEAWVPDACTLPTAERPLRLAEFDDLFATTVRRVDRPAPRHLRLTLSGPPDLAHRVRDLAARESECCAFFAFTLTGPAAGPVFLDIEVPERQVEVLDALHDRAIRLRGTR